MDRDKPHWMKDHEADDQRNFDEILQSLKRLEDKINPVYEAYHTATILGSWTKILGAFILTLLAIWAGIKNLS